MNRVINSGPYHLAGTKRTLSTRETVVRTVTFIFILSIIEGPLRKWVFPGASSALYFLRDPFVIGLYAYAAVKGAFRISPLARWWLGFAAASSMAALAVFFVYDLGPIVWMLGVRTYWLYVPLAFVVAATFREEDVLRLVRLAILISIPYAVLVYVQYQSPAEAWLNKGVGADDISVGLALGLVRPNGLFTFTSQNVWFVALLVAAYLALLLHVRKTRSDRILAAVGAFSVSICVLLTGSRAIYFLVGAIVSVSAVGGLVARPDRRTLGTVAAIAATGILAAYLFSTALSDMLAAMTVRFGEAIGSEGSIASRPLSLFSLGSSLRDAPIFGYGMGTGTPAVTKFLEVSAWRYGEGELQRIVYELGIVFGLPFLFLRAVTAIWLVLIAFARAREGAKWCLPFAGFVSVQIAVGEITSSSLNALFPWLLVGILLSIRPVRLGLRRRKAIFPRALQQRSAIS